MVEPRPGDRQEVSGSHLILGPTHVGRRHPEGTWNREAEVVSTLQFRGFAVITITIHLEALNTVVFCCCFAFWFLKKTHGHLNLEPTISSFAMLKTVNELGI